MTIAERVEDVGIRNAADAVTLLRGVVERQDGSNGPEDGEEMYVVVEAFKWLDANHAFALVDNLKDGR